MRFLLRNWHLKLSAVLLATVLYTGLVFSGSFSDADIQVRVDQENASRDSYVLTGDLGFVTVNYRVSNEVAGRIVADSFQASVDLSDYDMERSPQPQQLPIDVRTDLEAVFRSEYARVVAVAPVSGASPGPPWMSLAMPPPPVVRRRCVDGTRTPRAPPYSHAPAATVRRRQPASARHAWWRATICRLPTRRSAGSAPPSDPASA